MWIEWIYNYKYLKQDFLFISVSDVMIVFQTTTKADCRQMVVDCVFMFSADSDKGNE